MARKKKQLSYAKKAQQAARVYAPLVGYFLLGVAASWFIFAIAALACPYFYQVNKVADVVPSTSTYAMERSLPAHISIPSVGIDAPFGEPVGVDDNGAVEVPNSFIQVGWYKFGPTPGERGPAVVLGHVDSVLGPAVFYTLKDLESGDLIYIEREGGTTATFEVTELRSVSQDKFPTEDVYGDIGHAGLRLITCTGVYDHGELEYSHNLIVFARLIETE